MKRVRCWCWKRMRVLINSAIESSFSMFFLPLFDRDTMLANHDLLRLTTSACQFLSMSQPLFVDVSCMSFYANACLLMFQSGHKKTRADRSESEWTSWNILNYLESKIWTTKTKYVPSPQSLPHKSTVPLWTAWTGDKELVSMRAQVVMNIEPKQSKT